MPETYVRLKNGEIWVLDRSFNDHITAYPLTPCRLDKSHKRMFYYPEILTMDTSISNI